MADGIPKIPHSIASSVKRYQGLYGLPLTGWNPHKREIWLKGLSSVTLISRVERPGHAPKIWTMMPVGDLYDLYFHPQAKYLIYNKDTAGNEAFQIYLYNFETQESTLLTDGKSRNVEPVWSNSGDRIIYGSTPLNGNGVDLYVINPLDPKTNRLLVKGQGGYLKVFDWSPDDRQVLYYEFISSSESYLWIVDVATGEKTLLTPRRGTAKARYESPQFAKDGKGIYVITDRDSEFRRLAYLDLVTKRFKYLTNDLPWDVDEFQLSPDGKTLALITNEEGISRLYLLDTKVEQEKRLVAGLPVGVISDLKWHKDSNDLAFNLKSPQTPNDVYALDVKDGKVECWSKSITKGVETDKFTEPELIHWKSTDGRRISGFIYRPPKTFTGKRPVIIEIHGGPAEQYRPEFGYEDNYFLNELGVVKIYPNVRGSSGYGKTFLNLDNGIRREDAVKDIGALLDWIKTQPDLDAERVLIQGSSYGGYMALAVAVSYGDRVRAAISDSGPSNLATFIEHTEGWRRDVQRAEFGDERDQKMRAHFERTAPLHNIHKFKKPLMIIQGQNDPRVKVSEAEQIVQAARKNGNPVWYLLAKDEGHGFAQQSNRDFALYSIILFVKEYLL